MLQFPYSFFLNKIIWQGHCTAVQEKVSYVRGSSINYQPVGTSESDVSPGKKTITLILDNFIIHKSEKNTKLAESEPEISDSLSIGILTMGETCERLTI